MSSNNSIKQFLLAVLIGATISYGLFYFIEDDYTHLYEQIIDLENKNSELNAILAKKDDELLKIRNFESDNNQQNLIATGKNSTQAIQQANKQAVNPSVDGTTGKTQDAQQVLKDLATRNDFNPRTFSERINDFLVADPSKENLALAAKAVVDMANNAESLPDIELEAVYQKHSDPDLKRVAAQVLSMRGDNSLLEKQIAESQSGLSSENAEVRQKTLVALAKTRYAGAADKIAPLLQDKNVGVKLDALLALRATGNESHVHFVQDLVNHPDPSVSWLAKDVIDSIQNLSEKARTKVNANDITAELPPIPNS